MQLSPEQLEELTAAAAMAAREAGKLIADFAQRDFEVMHKSAGDSLASQVVTEVDEKAQAIILELLDPSIKQFDLALLAEETPDDGSRHVKDYFWCIDPMDGTLPFTRRKPGYAVSIGLVRSDGIPMIGVVFDPVLKRLYTATHRQGISIDGRQWILAEQKPRAESELSYFCDCAFEEDPDRERRSSTMKAFAEKQGFGGSRIIVGGGAVLNACEVLLNRPAIYFKRPKPQLGGGSCWDFAASSCLFAEAGASASDFKGLPLHLNDQAYQFFNHCGVCFTTDESLVEPLSLFFAD
ncbi:MAG: inositol monophosphatase family protein [Verrucomicrobiota bacterium]